MSQTASTEERPPSAETPTSLDARCPDVPVSTPAVYVADIPVYGVDVDSETRCEHHHTERDVIAIRFACCGDYFPCLTCHEELADHSVDQWQPADFDTPAVLCGSCGTELTIRAYLESESTCPDCGAGFNPGCRNHWPAYFAVEASEED